MSNLTLSAIKLNSWVAPRLASFRVPADDCFYFLIPNEGMKPIIADASMLTLNPSPTFAIVARESFVSYSSPFVVDV